jgi:competence protein ComEC
MVVMFSATSVVLLWSQPLSPLLNRPPQNWVMMSCDVGQGDSTILNVAPRQAVVVDVGGDPDAIDRCLTQVGVTEIPLLVLTHFHADHVGGLEGALRNREIGAVRVTELQDPLITTRFALDVLRANQLQWEVVKFPQRLSVGSITLTCLWPAREIRGQGSDANNASIALVVEMNGMSALLAGDMEPPAQEAAIQNLAPMDFDVIKVPHHGSKYQSTDFAIWASPKFAVISAGKKNDYGHPAASTIELYRSVGAEVLRTDQLGSIFVVKDSGGMHVVTQ